MIENEKASIECWICGNVANSGEHIIKASDLKIALGSVGPVYLNGRRKLQSIKSNILTFQNIICKKCNNETTQPYDRAWEVFSKYINNVRITPKDKFRFNKIFPYNTKHSMHHVHLYFVKILGCIIAENKLNINLDKFSQSIKKDKLHPNIYIVFGTPLNELNKQSVMISNINICKDSQNNECVFATFSIFLPHITTTIIYAKDNEERDGLLRSWHPNKSTMCTKIFDTNE